MYEQESGFTNDKATGVCYNNIGNLHLKNGKYQSAYLNFVEAIKKVGKLRDKHHEKIERAYQTRVLAHRMYQMTVTQYKALKYGKSTKTRSSYGAINDEERGLLLRDKLHDYDWTWKDILASIDDTVEVYESIEGVIQGRR